MPLFSRNNDTLGLIRHADFRNEKELQILIEKNIEQVFSCRFVATEFSTGPVHGGRIDTLAISEDSNPVIIEYKAVESSQLVNQSLFYLSWISDHRGDFEVAYRRRFPDASDEIDWSDIRVICIAPDYKKYDIHAVKMMGANIELWKYRLFNNDTLLLEEVYRRAGSLSTTTSIDAPEKNPIMVAAGKKAAQTRLTGTYTYDQHAVKLRENLQPLLTGLRDFLLGLDDSVEEAPKKLYVAYKISKNFVSMEVHKNRLLLYLKIDPRELSEIPPNCRDVKNIGHFGTGDFEVSVANEAELVIAKEYAQLSFENIGGN